MRARRLRDRARRWTSPRPRARAAGGTVAPAAAALARVVAELAAARAPVYRRAHAVVDTNGRTIAEVVARGARRRAPRGHGRRRATDATIVALGERSYPVTSATRSIAGARPRARSARSSKLALDHGSQRRGALARGGRPRRSRPRSRSSSSPARRASRSRATSALCDELVAARPRSRLGDRRARRRCRRRSRRVRRGDAVSRASRSSSCRRRSSR